MKRMIAITSVMMSLSTPVLCGSPALAASPGPAPQTAQKLYASSVSGVVAAPAASDRVSRGYLVYQEWCAGCHAPDPALQKGGGGLVGRVFAGTYILQQVYRGAEPGALADRRDLTAATITNRVRQGYNIMPRFRKTEIPDTELQALIAYLTRNNPK